MEVETQLRDRIEAICLGFTRYGYRCVPYQLKQSENRSIWLAAHYDTSQVGGQGNKQEAGTSYLEGGGAESATEAALLTKGWKAGELVNKAEHPNHAWSYDFLEDRTELGGKLKILVIIDEFTRESLDQDCSLDTRTSGAGYTGLAVPCPQCPRFYPKR